MKTSGLRLLGATCFACVLTVVPSFAQHELPADQAAAETATFLRDIIRFDTQDPPGNESQVAEYVAAVFKREGIPYEILETLPGRASIVARLKGDGSKRPVMLMAHEDVVPVDRSRWSFDPFAATEKDGIIYGRGALDDKSPLAGNLETILQLHRSGKKLKRDVIFLAEASEENASEAGIRTLIAKYWDKIDCEFALNEGGAADVDSNGKVPYLGIATGEKVGRGVKLIAKGHSGHASVPVLDNAVVHLAVAVGKIGTWDTPMHPNESTRIFFSKLATISPPDKAAIYRNLSDPKNQATLHREEPQFYSMLHTSVVPTILKAGFKTNVIPGDAEATIDIRALPDENMKDFYQAMEKLIDDPSITIVRPANAEVMPPQDSSIHTDMFAALEKAQKILLPNAITTPMMTTGGTDSSPLRGKGVQAYGLRVPRTFQENTSVHGDDERVQTKFVALYQQYTYLALLAVAE